jgi:Ca-activated chloride channel homolog
MSLRFNFYHLVSIIFFSVACFAQSNTATIEKNDGEVPVIKTKTQIVTLTATVVDKTNRPIPGLTRDNFEIYEDKIKQNIEYFAETDIPVSVGIVFDLSSSMGPKLDRAREALKAFVSSSHPDDDFFLITFDEKAKVVADFTDGDSALKKLTSVNTKGGTALYDAVFLGLENLKQGRHKKRVLIVISDGQDNCSRYSLREISQYVKESEAIIYGLSISEMIGADCGTTCQMYARRAMEDLAGFTGGKSYFPNSMNELEQATSQIALELRRQYSIGYVPTRTDRSGKWRKIQVRLKGEKGTEAASPNLVIRAKEGYYAQP